MPLLKEKKPIRTIADLQDILDAEVLDHKGGQYYGLPKIFEGVEGNHTLTIAEVLFFSKLLNPDDIRSFLEKVGAKKPVREDVIADIAGNLSAYDEKFDPLGFN